MTGQQQNTQNARKLYNNFIVLPPMKPKYTPQDWAQREQEYITSVHSIMIPDSPDPADITAINAMLDQVYTTAKIEWSTYKRLFEKFDRRRKLSETEVYIIIKRNLPLDSNGNPEKRTEAEMKALGSEYLNNTPDATYGNGQYTIYQLLEMAEERYIFMDAIIDLLRKKSDILITDSGAMKLEVQIK